MTAAENLLDNIEEHIWNEMEFENGWMDEWTNGRYQALPVLLSYASSDISTFWTLETSLYSSNCFPLVSVTWESQLEIEFNKNRLSIIFMCKLYQKVFC